MPLPQDRIVLQDLTFYGYHGVLAEENALGQRFRVNLECGVDLREAGRTDELAHTVSYPLIIETVRAAVEQKRFKLVEALAEHIAQKLFETFPPLLWLRVRIRKPEAPVPIAVGEFAVEIYRERG